MLLSESISTPDSLIRMLKLFLNTFPEATCQDLVFEEILLREQQDQLLPLVVALMTDSILTLVAECEYCWQV